MYAYRTPGVYFEWLDQPRPIAILRTDVAGFLGFAERGPLHTPVRIISMDQFRAVFGGFLRHAYLAYSVQGFFDNGGRACWIVRIDDPDDARTSSLVVGTRNGATRFRLIATSPGRWGNQVRVRIVAGSPERPQLLVRGPDGTEQFLRDPVGDLAVTAVPAPGRELLVRVEAVDPGAPLDLRTGEPARTEAWLTGGADGIERVRPEHFSGEGSTTENPIGLASLDRIDDVALIAAPDMFPKPVLPPLPPRPKPPCDRPLSSTSDLYEPPPPLTPPRFDDTTLKHLQDTLIAHCVERRDRFAILDLPQDARLPEQALAWRNAFPRDESFAALYFPWLLVNDPLEIDGPVRAIPPSGHLAGVYARVDLSQGVHQAPANEVVEGARDLTFRVTPAEHGDLNTEGVNAIVAFPGGGIRVMGGRTLYEHPLLRYISVRRLLLMIEEAIDEQTQWIVFEPHDDTTRRETERAIRSFLDRLFRAGMLAGKLAAEAYSVQCDARNNPPEDVDAGRLICDIGVQPPWPAEFVVVRIGKTQSGIEIVEERTLELSAIGPIEERSAVNA